MTVDTKCGDGYDVFTGTYDAVGDYRGGVVYVKQSSTSSSPPYLYRLWTGGYLDWENGIVGWKFRTGSLQVGSFIDDSSDEENQIVPLNKDTDGK